MKHLRSIFKEVSAFLIRYCGIPWFIRNNYAKNKATIIVYHNPKRDVLERHLDYLSMRYNFITLHMLIGAIYSQNWANIPPKSLVITFDDGHRGNFELLKVFQKYNVIPTIYICSQIVNTNRHFWFKKPDADFKKNLKKYNHSKRLMLLKKNIGFTLNMEYPEEERQALNKEEMILMKDYVDFQSHSLFHPVMATCPNDECRKEIFESKEDIETLLNKDCRHFSYPAGNYTEREIELLKKAGYLSARTIDVGWNNLNTDPYMLKTTGIADNASINWLSVQLTGMTDYLRYLLRGDFRGKHPIIKKMEETELNLTFE